MRTLVAGLLTLFVAGCSGSSNEANTVDADSTGAMAEAEPAVLTPEGINGTWNGVSMGEVGDSVTSRWTYTRNVDGTASFMYEGASESVSYATILSGDSVVSTSESYTARNAPAGAPEIMVRSVGRLVHGKLVGTTTVMLATSPDSVIARGRWEATRTPQTPQ